MTRSRSPRIPRSSQRSTASSAGRSQCTKCLVEESVITGLWVVSILGSCCNFLTLFYIVLALLHVVPIVYEKYEDKIDSFGEKAVREFKKQYAVFDAKVLSKIPKGPLKDKKN
ncbi:hypothetical protein HPP92_002894 [Vanilla planifolia]|uniref:Reticulon-like protein n=1 Tax=Vanilla planifolia TaxID=51239 RepID=A0A835VID8_VANPL|nr:hypothetical protein HPP92_002894 [Vanilla planifolia]